jgi:hypothetical protein
MALTSQIPWLVAQIVQNAAGPRDLGKPSLRPGIPGSNAIYS